ncbi:hypothetical protein [Ruegeria sp. HKCCD7255]|uniref:hypothetical protein n=1 Tax=Ruegeria sp. HKCCD7255 TaxID=2683004 RepID=UPI001489DFAA|nr:hypothetical protein [Ruegeria sp. HKCCD7255]
MKYIPLIFCCLLMGCDAIRSTSDRLFNRENPAPEPVATAEETVVSVTPEEDLPTQATVKTGWTGARTVVAGLGDPTTPGRWLQTPLVDVEVNGRVVVPSTGAQAFVTLIPAETGGSRLSLDAMRALVLPFDALVELDVYTY